MAGVATGARTAVLGCGALILVTIGTMLPFDRLIINMDAWAAHHGSEDVIAQIGEGKYEPRNMRWTRLIPPKDFIELARRAAVIVSHAGTGSYFLAAEISKPIVMLPRLAAKLEHTTDHQVHTARWLSDKPGVYVAATDEELTPAIEMALKRRVPSMDDFSPFAPLPFISRIRAYLDH